MHHGAGIVKVAVMMQGQNEQGPLSHQTRAAWVESRFHQFTAPGLPVNDQVWVKVGEYEVGEGPVKLGGVVGWDEGDQEWIGIAELQHLVGCHLSMPPLGHAGDDDEQHGEVPTHRTGRDGGGGQQQESGGANEHGLCSVHASQFVDPFLHQVKPRLRFQIVRLAVRPPAPCTQLNAGTENLLCRFTRHGCKGGHEQAERCPDRKQRQGGCHVGRWRGQDDHRAHHQGHAQPFAAELRCRVACHGPAALANALRCVELPLSTLHRILGAAESFSVGNRDAVITDQGLTSCLRRTLPL